MNETGGLPLGQRTRWRTPTEKELEVIERLRAKRNSPHHCMAEVIWRIHYRMTFAEISRVCKIPPDAVKRWASLWSNGWLCFEPPSVVEPPVGTDLEVVDLPTPVPTWKDREDALVARFHAADSESRVERAALEARNADLDAQLKEVTALLNAKLLEPSKVAGARSPIRPCPVDATHEQKIAHGRSVVKELERQLSQGQHKVAALEEALDDARAALMSLEGGKQKPPSKTGKPVDELKGWSFIASGPRLVGTKGTRKVEAVAVALSAARAIDPKGWVVSVVNGEQIGTVARVTTDGCERFVGTEKSGLAFPTRMILREAIVDLAGGYYGC